MSTRGTAPRPERNLSPAEMFSRLAAAHRPALAFPGGGRREFAAWKRRALPAVLRTLGDRPEQVPADPELQVEWEHDGLVKQRWLIDVGPHISAAFLVNRPKRTGARLPALLCCHGHGPFGKETVMGNAASAEMAEAVRRTNGDYGHQLAKAGFATFAIDWIGFGERNDSGKPHHRSLAAGRDWCNLYYLHATMLGTTSLAINLAHGRAATDFACTLDCVDPARLGVIGLSGGGTMALWLALADPRFRAVELVCYSDLWRIFGFRDYNYCGMQVAPGLFRLVDLPDLQGLLAPRPLLADIGVHDSCFNIDGAMACHRQVRRIYRAAGAADRLELDLFPGEHAWSGRRSVAFFDRWLAEA